MPKHYKRGDDVLRISQDIDKSRYARSLPLTPRARRVLDAICTEEGLIFRRFEYRRILVQAARKVLGTEHEAQHLSAHEARCLRRSCFVLHRGLLGRTHTTFRGA